MIKKVFLFFLFAILLPNEIIGQVIKEDSTHKHQLRKIILTETFVYSGSMAVLGSIWYKDDLNNKFHFFNDNNQWNGLDKAGHLFTAYQLTSFNAKVFQSANLSRNKSYLYAAISSSTMMLGIELFDGFSASYGASYGDILANTAGAFLPFQEIIWDEVYIRPKYSFHRTKYANLRPEVLGAGISEEWLKDYNGQTYWVSTNFNLLSKNNVFPDWLAFSIGYGANEMVYGNKLENIENGYQAYKQYFLSLDIDFSKIKTQQKWLKPILYGLNMLKVPFPAMELSKNGVTFHPLYF